MQSEKISDADFRTLGVDPGSELSEVKRAYRDLAKRWHPDRHHSKPFEVRALAEERFKQINEAYRRISGSRKRRGAASEKIRNAPGAQGNCAEASGPRPRVRKTYADTRIGRIAAVFVLAVLVFGLVYQVLTLPTGPSTRTQASVAPIFSGDNEISDAESAQPVDSKTVSEILSELSPPATTPSAPLLQTPESSKPYFTIGSNSEDVLLVQGAPLRIHGQTWVYGLSEIQFKNGRVWKYNNFDGSLKVLMLPDSEADHPPDFITIGSTQDEVLQVQGTPTRVEQDKWFYGFAEVGFKDGLLQEYDNYFGTLKVRLFPSTPVGPDGKKGFFTVGSSPDEVLALQGTPTSVHGNLWSFDFSSVFFRNGKVHYVTNSDGTLHFLPREEIGKISGS